MKRLKFEIIALIILSTLLTAQDQNDTAKVRKSDIDTIVVYTATDSAIYNVENREMFLFGGADIKYKTMRLRSVCCEHES